MHSCGRICPYEGRFFGKNAKNRSSGYRTSEAMYVRILLQMDNIQRLEEIKECEVHQVTHG
jgi:hypothetical protein